MREPIQIDGYKGFRYRELEPDLVSALPHWLATGRVDDGQDLKWGAVFRWRELVVKFGGARRRLRDRFRACASIRGADLYERLQPLGMPQPYLALERRSRRGLESQLLVIEFIEGRFLHDVFREDAHAVSEYARFIAEMHGRGIFHGDLHTLNALWDGERWVVIEMDGLRHSLHRLRATRLIASHWGLVSSSLAGRAGGTDEEVRAIFDEYVRVSRLSFDAESVWAEAKRHAAHRIARRRADREKRGD